MNILDFPQVLSEEKSSLKPGEMLTVQEPVIDELGQVKFDGYIYKFKQKFPDMPWRTPRDKKGYIEGEINSEPSMLDLTDYVDNKDVIEKLVRNLPEKALLGIASTQSEEGDYTSDYLMSEQEVYDEFDESDEPLDNVTLLDAQAQANQAEAVAEARSKNEKTSNSQVTANEQAQASEDKGTSEE